MADNLILPGTGENIALKELASGAKGQRVITLVDEADVSSANPLPVSTAKSTDLLYRYLDTMGDGTGTKNAVGNYSTPTQFFIAPPAATVYHIERMIVTIQDGATPGFRAEYYAGLAGALSNGVRVEKRQGASTTLIDLVDNVPITTNAEWGGTCYDVDLKAWGSGDEFILVRWTFSKTGGALRLDGDNSERLSVILEDNFAGVVTHRFMVQGHVV